MLGAWPLLTSDPTLRPLLFTLGVTKASLWYIIFVRPVVVALFSVVAPIVRKLRNTEKYSPILVLNDKCTILVYYCFCCVIFYVFIDARLICDFNRCMSMNIKVVTDAK